jgi:hypothetical protein
MRFLLTALGAAALGWPGALAATGTEATASAPAQMLAASSPGSTTDFSVAAQAVQIPGEFAEHSQRELVWRGLASLYPEKVLTAPPVVFTGHSPAPPLEAELPRGVTYLRLYDPALAVEALEAVQNPQKLILDLRYCATPAPASFVTLVEELGQTHPLIVLVNRRTAGQLEVQLADLQAAKKILTVGTPTAGQTGQYMPIPGLEGFYVLTEETLTADGNSLLGKGLTPSVAVDTTPQADYLAYNLVERGTSVAAVLQMQVAAPTAPATTPNDAATGVNEQKSSATTADLPLDATLQRGIDVIVALQVMGLLPPS